MLQAHSLLWHYLWLGPNLLLLGLFAISWRCKIGERFPAFVAFTFLSSLEGLSIYAADIAPRISARAFWIIFCTGLLMEAIAKFFLLGEIFHSVCGNYPAIAQIGRLLIRGVGLVLILIASIAAAYAPRDSLFKVVYGAHILEEAMYMVECGVLLFIFLFAAHYRLAWNRLAFGISLGLSIAACVQLADWAVTANGGLHDQRHILDFINMFAYHVCVLVWYYYVLSDARVRSSRQKRPPTPPESPAQRLPEIDLEELNHELEQLLHR